MIADRSPHGLVELRRDQFGRLERAVVHDPGGPIETVFERDRFGRVVAETSSGRTVRSVLDAEGRRHERAISDGPVTRYSTSSPSTSC